MEAKISEQLPMSCFEVREYLVRLTKESTELGYRAGKVLEYLNSVIEIDTKTHNTLKQALLDLGIARLRERHVVKLLDIVPRDVQTLKGVLSGEALVLKQEEFDQIQQVINEHVAK